MKTGEVIRESENKVSQQFWKTLGREICGSRGILLKLKDNLSREDRTRALTNIGFSKKEIGEMSTEAEATVLERGTRRTVATVARETDAVIVTHEQPVSRDAWKENLKKAVTVARTMTGRDNLLSIVWKSMKEVER
jgi:hypothetical protein